MAEITYPHFDQHYSKYIFRNSMSHNLQRAEENGDNIKFYWINFIFSLLFLCKQFHNPKLKVVIIISSLIHLTITYNALSVSFNNVTVIMNLKNYPTNEFFTIEVLHITYKINEFSTNMHLKLLTINKMKYKSNHLYLKMTLLLPGDINLNPGPVTRHQLNGPKFEGFNNKDLHLIHLNPLSTKFIKWSNTLRQIVGKLPTICLSVFDHFSGLALKGLILTVFCLK